ncbi:hypothetical protein ACVWZV_009627 [Bradyrhizobium sp. GM5.1]
MVAASVRRSVVEIVFLLPGGTLLANEPGFVAWEMLLTFISYPLRRAGGGADTESSKSALSRPFVPLRQLTVFHLALASICSAAIDKISGTWCFRGLPRALVIGQMSSGSISNEWSAENPLPPTRTMPRRQSDF